MKGIAKILVCCAFASGLHLLAWRSFEQTAHPRDVDGRLDSLSYVPTASAGRPDRVDGKRVHDDLARLAMVARSIRTYSATGGMAAVPPMAERFGMTVSVGAWIGRDAARNAAEINGALRAAAANANVDALIIGNEALLRNDVSVAALRAMLRRTRANTTVPVTTAEPWHVWLKHPALANEVDFMAVHVLPYWEGVPADRAVAYLQEIYDRLTQAFPGRRIAIAEFGWPSDGHNRGHAIPGVLEQATVVRDIAAAAQHRGLGYNIVDAFDQPWKTAEGRVGPYWGLFDADRRQKFPLTGPVQDDHSASAVLAILLGGLLSVMTLAGRRLRFAHAAAATLAANAAGAGAALILLLPANLYMTAGEIVFWGLGLAMLLPLAAACLARCDTLARDLFGYSPQRLVRWPARPGEGWRWPKVSIHVPACREPPALVIACLDSLARLDYPRFEVVVVVNNTPDEDLWRPVEAHCRALGDRFGFLHLPRVDGYKAGALNEALAASDGEFIAVFDADFMPEPDFLKRTIRHFDDPQVGMVQTRWRHLNIASNLLTRVQAVFLDAHFAIEQLARARLGAYFNFNGTAGVWRKRTIEDAGGWRADTLTEDLDLS